MHFSLPVGFGVFFQNRRTKYLILFFIFQTIISSLSFATFAVERNLPQNRLQLAFTLTLTGVTFRFVTNQQLPKISYLTRLVRKQSIKTRLKKMVLIIKEGKFQNWKIYMCENAFGFRISTSFIAWSLTTWLLPGTPLWPWSLMMAPRRTVISTSSLALPCSTPCSTSSSTSFLWKP